MCGTSRWEWEENPYAYQAVIDVCPGCEAKDLARDDSAKMPSGGTMTLVPPAVATEMARAKARKKSITQRRREARMTGR
jgi:hypothetical protein